MFLYTSQLNMQIRNYTKFTYIMQPDNKNRTNRPRIRNDKYKNKLQHLAAKVHDC